MELKALAPQVVEARLSAQLVDEEEVRRRRNRAHLQTRRLTGVAKPPLTASGSGGRTAYECPSVARNAEGEVRQTRQRSTDAHHDNSELRRKRVRWPGFSSNRCVVQLMRHLLLPRRKSTTKYIFAEHDYDGCESPQSTACKEGVIDKTGPKWESAQPEHRDV